MYQREPNPPQTARECCTNGIIHLIAIASPWLQLQCLNSLSYEHAFLMTASEGSDALMNWHFAEARESFTPHARPVTTIKLQNDIRLINCTIWAAENTSS